MKCKCDGELERINPGTYECKMCGLKQAVAFVSPTRTVQFVSHISGSNAIANMYIEKIQEKINQEIYNAFKIPNGVMKGRKYEDK